MGKSQRVKGHNFEREIAKDLREKLPGSNARRGLQSQGEIVPDVDLPGLWIECKRGRKPAVRAALKQAVDNANPGRWRVAVIRDDREPAFVAMPYEDFTELLAQWWRLQNQQPEPLCNVPELRESCDEDGWGIML